MERVRKQSKCLSRRCFSFYFPNQIFSLSFQVPGSLLFLIHGRRNYKDTSPLMSYFLVFCLEWCSNFLGSEYGQKQSIKLLQNMFYDTTLHPARPSPTQPHTVCMYCTFSLGRGGGVGEVREKVEGQQFTRGFEMTINSIKHQ